jgi:hypothetical protein
MTRHADGRRSFGGDLDAVGGEKFELALESIVQASRPKGDPRTRGQQRGDALVQLCDRSLACGGLPILCTVKPHVALTLTAADFFDPHVTGGLARLGFGAWLTATQARAVACDGRITPIHGDTSVENSGLLCERHHTKVHHGFRIERDPEGRWHTYRPDGTEILIEPRIEELLDEPLLV